MNHQGEADVLVRQAGVVVVLSTENFVVIVPTPLIPPSPTLVFSAEATSTRGRSVEDLSRRTAEVLA
jgi:hypothetical protein